MQRLILGKSRQQVIDRHPDPGCHQGTVGVLQHHLVMASIVNITSMGGKIHTPIGAWYYGTKFALEDISDCLRMEVEPFGIDVVVIEPGGIKTEWAGISAEKLLELSGTGLYAA